MNTNIVELINSSYKNIGENPRLKKNGKPYKWISVVPLIGGMSIGNSMFTRNKPEALISYEPFVGNDSHLVNYWSDVPYYLLDEELNDGTLIEGTLPPNVTQNVDFVSAVCPCAGLSALNNSSSQGSTKKRGSDAEQNDWMYKVANFVLERIQPKVFWGENAPGLFTAVGEGVVKKLQVIAEKFDYSFSLVKTNSFLHRTPQKRERTFYFFWKSEQAPILSMHSYPMMKYVDFIKHVKGSDLKEQVDEAMKEKISDLYPMYEFVKEETGLDHAGIQKEFQLGPVVGIINRINKFDKAMKWMEEKYPDSWDFKMLKHVKKKMAMKKGWWDSSPHVFYKRINAVVGNNVNVVMHPFEERFLVMRELMYIMGLPSDFHLVPDEKGNMPRNHIAQNVPAITAMDWTAEVCKFIDDELKFSDERFLKQRNRVKMEQLPDVASLF